jgi:hypothetical protein
MTTHPVEATPSPLEVLQADVQFLKGYLGLPCKLRRISAEHWAEAFRASTDDLLRKTALVKVYEDFIASTEDLAMFYFALKTLGLAPRGVMSYCDRFRVTGHEEEWNQMLAAIPAGGHFLEGYFPEVDDPLAAPVDRQVINRVFRKLTNALKGAAASRLEGQRLLVEGANKVKHGMLIQDAGDTVILDVTRAPHSGIPVTDEYVEMLRDAIVAMRQATAVIVSAIIQRMHLAAAKGDYGLEPIATGILLKSFKEMPSIF